MTQELTTEMSDEQFNQALNQATNYGSAMPTPPTLNFNATQGVFYADTGEKDTEGKPIQKELGQEIEVHITVMRNMLKDYGNKCYSRETEGNFFEIFNSEDKNFSDKGFWKDEDLKKKYPTMKYNKVLYVFFDSQLYRMKLGGSKLSNLFSYTNAGNPAMTHTKLSIGNRMKGVKGGQSKLATNSEVEEFNNDIKQGRKPNLNLFYELKIEKLDPVEKNVIIERVNQVNEYLQAYYSAKNATVSPPSEENAPNAIPAPENDTEPLSPAKKMTNYKPGMESNVEDFRHNNDDIKVESIPF